MSAGTTIEATKAAKAAPAVDAVRTGQRIEDVLDRLATTGDPAARAAAEELVQALMDFYGAGLARMLHLLSTPVGRRTPGDPLAGLLGDELVASLLVLHDLHPEDRTTRITRALDSVRDHELDVVDFDEETGTLRLRAAGGGGCGCAASGTTAQQAAEGALACFAPEVTAVEVQAAGRSGEPTLLQIGTGPGTRATTAAPAPAKAP
ncbi:MULTISPECIES: hypothetical protein [unclassified Streptomyces]|uniref:hypothetical protein n=1 Tax=unclassified Streptomyces TaxID=2593676 RepID=UPI0011648C49|nr:MULTISPECIES: hypothetical protein [unclassified Streptomyces]NMI62975.1 hypothetical protein [Streptomyces sp. RLA2-12]QDN61937.1 hypothetical protein FNV67_47580 [Streptomyces sp. S1D4-20]QDN71989.1 hypothetical protein FNV66_46430 [Streptomyces sp. S1D4-14]QDO54447.1 hypothetical protein FNV60_44910 [Streptomyces sp. RLB3-5]QDO64692.1 hypothetical protein FNV59_47165 [Streptomyces sp. RLB1-8]